MKAYFKNEVTDFIIESIEYALHKAIPSQSTIEIHFRLLFEYYQNLKSDKERDYYCLTRPPKVRPKKSNFGGRYFYVKIQL